MTSKAGSKVSWHPALTVDTTTSSYWSNWRVILCGIWVFITMIFASFLIWKYEGFRDSNRNRGESQQEKAGSLYEDETWKPCLKGVHPAWLLVFRVIAFFVLLMLLIATGLFDGGSIFYYYTQWTCTSITIYFGLGSLLSLYGCYQYHKTVGGDKVDNVEVDAEHGNFVTPAPGESSSNAEKLTNTHGEFNNTRQPAGFWGYFFQIIFQMNAGAVLLTDCVFWFIIVPFLEINNYSLNVLVINMHTVNAVFLLGDAALNCLRFPMFRIAYFFLWTVAYVIFQWVLHACVKIWWPYPFLDLSSSYAPLWYLSVAVMHIPCYGIFALAIKLKHTLMSRRFPDSYQCVR
ncbi:UDP-N-acetylglucosamine-N-acetylmuramyl-pyrophosphoryl-undecaprenol N-acetylglucosamine protein [Melia azedarach]|uniref:UDP-N-acetylglucosamine-N-acetylmuramyl-pyrophosphoryl-undecaprenol N-acetylglucosamine protein n=1 Tax=Melia azedarach TaxID=155640 RepID=A0ACC1XLF2_MELAZ|nr:UDP-N-acetylglucosamine-N-acetylmuramyl-pyrophosphoryl-undecaprenol N-acetylglucosamine protein [Melia azedarach]